MREIAAVIAKHAAFSRRGTFPCRASSPISWLATFSSKRGGARSLFAQLVTRQGLPRNGRKENARRTGDADKKMQSSWTDDHLVHVQRGKEIYIHI